MSELPLTEFSRLLGTKTVSILVGPKSTQYFVHKALLCGSVPYFDKAFNGSFSEAQSNEIHLLDTVDDPAAFDLFCQWLYKDKLPAIPYREEWRFGLQDMEASGYLAAETTYHSLYYLAEKWCIPRLKNVALDCIRNIHRSTANYIHPSFIAKGYANTSTGSLLRRYLSDAAAFAINDLAGNSFIDLWDSTIGLQEPELLADVIRAAKRAYELGHVDPDNGDGSKYHEDELKLGSKHSKEDLSKGHQ